MIKAALVLLFGFVALGPSFNGCKDLTRSVFHLTYPPHRDMRNSVVISPQKLMLRPPDSLSVPIGGREVMLDRVAFEGRQHNPMPGDSASITRGEQKFRRTCTPCHGLSMKGDGPVTAKFIPPPDLLGPGTRGRSDGFIYTYIRHGGAVMPSYGAQVSAQEAWDVINFIRDQQRKNPR